MNFQREYIKFAGHITTSRDYMGYDLASLLAELFLLADSQP